MPLPADRASKNYHDIVISGLSQLDMAWDGECRLVRERERDLQLLEPAVDRWEDDNIVWSASEDRERQSVQLDCGFAGWFSPEGLMPALSDACVRVGRRRVTPLGAGVGP